MLIRFNNQYLQKLYEGKPVPGKLQFSEVIIIKFKKTILKMQYASDSRELRKFKGLNFESLKGNLKGYYSVRVDLKYRLIFQIEQERIIKIIEVIIIEDLSKHCE